MPQPWQEAAAPRTLQCQGDRVRSIMFCEGSVPQGECFTVSRGGHVLRFYLEVRQSEREVALDVD